MRKQYVIGMTSYNTYVYAIYIAIEIPVFSREFFLNVYSIHLFNLQSNEHLMCVLNKLTSELTIADSNLQPALFIFQWY